MALIQISNLSFTYEGGYTPVFDGVTFQLDTDWKLGFVGRNGRGKTTLCRILTGELPHAGTVSAPCPFGYFPAPVPDMGRPMADALRAAGSAFEDWALERELSLLDVSPETWARPFDTLSPGERVKAQLAALFAQADPRFLLIDEPTDHLDERARASVARYLGAKRGFILVSHDRYLLDAVADHILSINRGGVEVVRGNFSSWFADRTARDRFELEQNRRIRKDVKRLEQTAREKADWSDQVEATKIGTHQGDRGRIGHLAAKMMKRSKSIERRVGQRLEEKEGLLKNIEKTDALAIHPLPRLTDTLVSLRGVSAYYGEHRVCENVSFTVGHGERVVLKGRNGSGKSSILWLILAWAGITVPGDAGILMPSGLATPGEAALSGRSSLPIPGAGFANPPASPPDSTARAEAETLRFTGELHTASRLVVSYVPQDTSRFSGLLSDYARAHGLDESLFKAILRKLDFSRAQFDTDIRNFSSGMKKKTLIAASLCQPAHLYVWDEPLNFVDVLSRVQIESLLLQGGLSMLFVEHDRVFTETVATKTVELAIP